MTGFIGRILGNREKTPDAAEGANATVNGLPVFETEVLRAIGGLKVFAAEGTTIGDICENLGIEDHEKVNKAIAGLERKAFITSKYMSLGGQGYATDYYSVTPEGRQFLIANPTPREPSIRPVWSLKF